MQRILQAIQKVISKYHAGWAVKARTNIIRLDGEMGGITRREPVGLIIPWNFRLNMLAWKLGPAPLIFYPNGARIAFTGTSTGGHKIVQFPVKSNLEKTTGDKSPIVVLPGADLDQMAMAAHFSFFLNPGQCCYVHEDIYDQFMAKLVVLVKNWNTKDSAKFQMHPEPMVEKMQFDKIMGYIGKGKNEDAKLEFGGNRDLDKGYFIRPTVFTCVEDGMFVAKEEFLGTMMSILKFKDFSGARP